MNGFISRLKNLAVLNDDNTIVLSAKPLKMKYGFTPWLRLQLNEVGFVDSNEAADKFPDIKNKATLARRFAKSEGVTFAGNGKNWKILRHEERDVNGSSPPVA